MNIAIIGGGFTGLTAAYELTKLGLPVTVYEREPVLGGLAHGFRQPGWDWSLEFAYHHVFTRDAAILSLMRESGLGDAILVKRPVTATLVNDRIYQLDSPASLLRFPPLPLLDRVRTGAMIAFCKFNPFWQPLERDTAVNFFSALGGKTAWSVLWEPLLTGKFGAYADSIAASWLWARFHARTTELVYIRGGFQTFVDHLAETVTRQGGVIRTNTGVSLIRPTPKGFIVTVNGKTKSYDRVLLTTPTPIAAKLVPALPREWIAPALTIPHLSAQLLILETKRPLLKDIYWLNINDRSFPFLAAVAHTNFMEPAHYGGHHLTYFGNYLPPDHQYFAYPREKLYRTFLPYIKRLAPDFNPKADLITSYLFAGPYAQPVHQVNYSRLAPPLTTPIAGLYLANMDSIYPWDRGTNYAVDMGRKAAARMTDVPLG